MTGDHLNRFNEDDMHVWIPDFTVDAPEGDKLWITMCYSIALYNGFDSRYEFYLSDWKYAQDTPISDVWAFITFWNQKYSKWIKIGNKNKAEAFFHIQRDDWTFVEHYVKPGLWQRKWVHAFNQLFDHQGFRYDAFQETDAMWQFLGRMSAWSSVTQTDAWWFSNADYNRWSKSRLAPTHEWPWYLQPPRQRRGGKPGNGGGSGYHKMHVNHKLKAKDND